MLDHLIVKNYRLFKDLNIPKLGQVNLVTGKNNAGKSTLLEVIRIWASRGNSSVVNSILDKRGDWKDGDEEGTYAALFTDRMITYSASDLKHGLDENIFINDFWIGFDYDHAEIRRQKAFVHTWLSWQETPGASMGLTMKGNSDLFDLQQPNAQAFLA
ncbi:MAG: AAA family ATPase [Saprospiraceae bacterium]|nr:AAA family ATPase [Saprospiraceae bacterium]MDZ4702617.1 AAA family ATPase [Saprospiraceae bacterium]